MLTQTLNNPAARMLGILPAASVVTLLILYVMHQLVHTDFGELVEPEEPPKIPTFLKEDVEITTVYDELVKPAKPVPPQIQPAAPEPEPVEVDVDVKSGVVIGILKPPVDIVLPVAGGDQAMPFIKVQPQYPATASERGIEGYVDVVFDVAATGATENIRIVNAFPSSVFNRSVVQAIKRWKYKPKLVDNQPVKSFDVRERITFELEKG